MSRSGSPTSTTSAAPAPAVPSVTAGSTAPTAQTAVRLTGLQGPWRLLATYLLITAVPVLALGAALAVGYHRQATQTAQEHGRAQADVISQMVVLPALTGDSLELGLPPRVQERLQIAADFAVRQQVLSRLRLRAFSGYTAFADDGSASTLPRTDPAFQDAVEGRTHIAVVTDPTISAEPTVRVLRPLPANATGRSTGVLELYIPYAPIAADAQSRLRQQYLLLAGALVLLCAALSAIAWGTTRRLRNYAAAHAHEARHDALTGLPNRAAFTTELETLITAGQPGLVGLLDLDGFKSVNDVHGHRAGDDLLRTVAQQLTRTLPPGAIAARLGGDEFAVLVPGTEPAGAQDIVSALQQSLTAVMQQHFSDLPVGASVGGALYPVHGSDASTLLHCADLAMYRAKHDTGQAELYQPWRATDLLPRTRIAPDSTR